MSLQSYGFILRRTATVLSVIILTLVSVAAITGILIAFYYEPTATGAYNSLKSISLEIPNGWLIRSLHNIAGNGLIVISLVQIIIMFLGEKLRRSWVIGWMSGILITLVAIALSWTAMILDWSQLGYWRFRIELGTIAAIPLIGNQLSNILTGGAVSSITVKHLYTLHSYVLAVGALLLSIVHLASLLKQEKQEKAELVESLSTSSYESALP